MDLGFLLFHLFSTEGDSAVLQCLKDPPEGPPENLTWYREAQTIPFLRLNQGSLDLGVQKGPQSIWLIIFNVSEQMGGFYQCTGDASSNQAWRSSWTVSVEGSGEGLAGVWYWVKFGSHCGPREVWGC